MMESAATGESVTRLLKTWGEGDDCARERLLPLVYQELRQIAQRELRRERSNTLESRELVHEAYERLIDSDVSWRDRTHFFALCSRTMRRILVDHARRKARHKRGGGITLLTLERADDPAITDEAVDVLVIDEALTRLGAIEPRMERIVELHFFAGLTYEEVSVTVGISTATVYRDLTFAKAWLRRYMTQA